MTRLAQIDPGVVSDPALDIVIQQHRTRNIVLRHHIEVHRQLVIAVNQVGRQRDGKALLARIAPEVAPDFLQRPLLVHRQVVEEGAVERDAQQGLVLINPAFRREAVANL